MARLIDGKLISKQIKDELKEEAAQLKEQEIVPCLAAVSYTHLIRNDQTKLPNRSFI